MESVVAPKLKFWEKYKEEVTFAMTDEVISQDVNDYLKNDKFTMPLATRKIILRHLYNLDDDHNIEKWQMKKLNNVLLFNREEICDNFKMCVDAGHGFDAVLIEEPNIEDTGFFIYIFIEII